LEIKTRIYGNNSIEVAKTAELLGVLKNSLAEYKVAEVLLRKAISIREKNVKSERTELARCLEELAAVYRNIGRTSDARALEKRAASIRNGK